MKIIHFIEFFQISSSHGIFDDLKKVENTKQSEQSETRP